MTTGINDFPLTYIKSTNLIFLWNAYLNYRKTFSEFNFYCSTSNKADLPPLFSLLDLYCTLEVDSFGYFVSKAKTRVFRDTTEPQWNEVSNPGFIWLSVSPLLQHLVRILCINVIFFFFKGVWDWVGRLPVPPHPVLWEVLWQKHAQQGWQWDCGQDHGKRASPGKKIASDRQLRGRCSCSLGDVSQNVTHFN